MMRIEEYLHHLCAALKVDPLRRDEIRLEVHTHLRQRAYALMQKGLPLETAEEWATEEFGAPEEVAFQMSRIPPPPAVSIMDRHVSRLGRLMIAAGIGYFPLLLYTNGLRDNLSLAVAFTFGPLHVLLGRALLLKYRWARLSTLMMGLFYLWLARWIVPHLPWSFFEKNHLRTTLILILWILILGCVGLYSLWIFIHPRRRQIHWNSRGSIRA